MSGFDFQKAAEEIRETYKDKKKAASISTGAEMTNPKNDEDFLIMPPWFQEGAGLKGIPFGHMVMISGNPDSGKTSCTIEAMRQAQAQGVLVILVDTERKTTKTRLENWGVDPINLARVQPANLEEAYDGIDDWITKMKAADENNRILVVFDSVANTASKKERESTLDDTMQLGIAAKTNKRGLRRLIPRLKEDDIALLIINQTYDNMGSPGKSNAGGKALDFFSSLTFQTSRKAWLEKTVKGEKIRVGATVKWNVYKNHLIEDDEGVTKTFDINITADGMALK